MKKEFSEYYRPSRRELARVWDNAIIALDANVLLNAYRYSTETRERLLEVLGGLKERLWIPHQAAKEYQTNRLTVISRQTKTYAKLREALEASESDFVEKCNAYRRHPLIDHSELMEVVAKGFSEIKGFLEETEDQHPDLLAEDPIREELSRLLANRVGPPYDSQELTAVLEEGRRRYDEETPPGYLDEKNKEGRARFGDWILWRQLLDYAKENSGRPVLLVSDDTKEDWWWRHDGRTIGPRPELRAEMRSEANATFYMYKMDQFLEHASRSRKEAVNRQMLDEMRAVRRELELRTAELEAERRRIDQEQESLMARRDMIRDRLERAMAELSDLESYVQRQIKKSPEARRELEGHEGYMKNLRKRVMHFESQLVDVERRLEDLRMRRKAREAMLREVGLPEEHLDLFNPRADRARKRRHRKQ